MKLSAIGFRDHVELPKLGMTRLVRAEAHGVSIELTEQGAKIGNILVPTSNVLWAEIATPAPVEVVPVEEIKRGPGRPIKVGK